MLGKAWVILSLRRAVLLAGLMLSGCDGGGSQGAAGSGDDQGVPAPEALEWINPDSDGLTRLEMLKMSCAPKEVGPDDILRVNIAGDHGEQAAIVGPDGDWSLIAHPSSQGEPLSPLSATFLKNSSTIALPIGDVRSKKDGEMVKVFVKAGTYRLIVAPQLEIDLEDIVPDAYCHFNFRPEKRGRRQEFNLTTNGWTGLDPIS